MQHSHFPTAKSVQPPEVPLREKPTASKQTQKPPPQSLETNYSHVDASGKQGGTGIDDIVITAYQAGCFKSGMQLTGLPRPQRFGDRAKYEHCLELLEYTMREDQREGLKNANLGATELQVIATEVSNLCMTKLDRWENNPKRGARTTNGYSGVGKRFQKIKRKNPQWRDGSIQRSIGDFTKK